MLLRLAYLLAYRVQARGSGKTDVSASFGWV